MILTSLATKPRCHCQPLRTKVVRERAGWLLRDSLTTLASIISERQEISQLEAAMKHLWRQLEDDRQEKYVPRENRSLVFCC